MREREALALLASYIDDGHESDMVDLSRALAALRSCAKLPTKLELEATPWMRMHADTGLLKTTRDAAEAWLAAYEKKRKRR